MSVPSVLVDRVNGSAYAAVFVSVTSIYFG